MRYVVNIPYNGFCHCFRLFLRKIDRIEVPGVLIFDIVEWHSHRYDLQAFFYNCKVIISCRSYRSKRDLYGAVQNLLQEYLNIDVQ